MEHAGLCHVRAPGVLGGQGCSVQKAITVSIKYYYYYDTTVIIILTHASEVISRDGYALYIYMSENSGSTCPRILSIYPCARQLEVVAAHLELQKD